MSHQRSIDERFEAIEDVLEEILRSLRKDENELNRLRRRLKPHGTYPQPVAMVVAVRQASQQSPPSPAMQPQSQPARSLRP